VRHASAASEGVRALRTFALQASRGRTRVPQEILDRHGVGPNEFYAGQGTPALASALAEFRGRVRGHAAEAMALLAQAVPEAAWPAFLHVGLAPLYLDRMEDKNYDPFKTAVAVPQWRRQWRLWRLARSLGEAR
jgi:phytoene synthase